MTDFTLSQLLQRSYRALGQYNTGKVTSGTVTTVTDGSQASLWSNNQWKNGCLFIVRTTDGLAPQGEFQRISAYDNSLTKFTVDTAFTAAPGAGDVYMFVDDTYPYLSMIEFANDGLQALDMLDLTDITTVSIAENQKEYAGAVEWKRSKPSKVERATSTDTNAYGWKEITDWDWNSDIAGSTPLIIFKQQYSPNYPTVKIHYRDLHPIVTDFDDKIREEVHPELAVTSTIVKALEWYDRSNSGTDEAIRIFLADSRNEFDRARISHPVTHSDDNVTAKTIELSFRRP